MFLISRLYPLRNQSVSENNTTFGIGVGFATFIYKIQPYILIAFLVINFINGEWLSPFLILIISFVVAVILGKLLVAIKVITPSSTQVSPVMMTICGVSLVVVDFLMIIRLI
jgi:hypothetical protein